jgi:hypothetical protein
MGDLLALDHIEERLRPLDAQIEQTSLDPRYASAVSALRCFASPTRAMRPRSLDARRHCGSAQRNPRISA